MPTRRPGDYEDGVKADFIAPIARVQDPAGLRARGDTRKLAAIAVSPVIAIAITAAAPARIFELAPALFCLAAVFTVAADFLFEFLFGLVDAPGASIVAVARLHGRGTAKQQEPAQRCREKRSPSQRSLAQIHTSRVQTPAHDPGLGVCHILWQLPAPMIRRRRRVVQRLEAGELGRYRKEYG